MTDKVMSADAGWKASVTTISRRSFTMSGTTASIALIISFCPMSVKGRSTEMKMGMGEYRQEVKVGHAGRMHAKLPAVPLPHGVGHQCGCRRRA
ncbi:MAG: hypothetical protein LKE45_08835 [Olsenella sp.]|nr:hypothetical protein [Olsenella sp.]